MRNVRSPGHLALRKAADNDNLAVGSHALVLAVSGRGSGQDASELDNHWMPHLVAVANLTWWLVFMSNALDVPGYARPHSAYLRIWSLVKCLL